MATDCNAEASLCVCVFTPSPIRVGTLLMEVPIGASFFEFELKSTGQDSVDPIQHEFQHQEESISKHRSRVEN